MGHARDVAWGSVKAGISGALPCPLAKLTARLGEDGLPTAVAMIDGALQYPRAPVPDDWREARLKTAAGMITLTRKAGAIAVVAFANADEALLTAHAKVCAALEALHPAR